MLACIAAVRLQYKVCICIDLDCRQAQWYHDCVRLGSLHRQLHQFGLTRWHRCDSDCLPRAGCQ